MLNPYNGTPRNIAFLYAHSGLDEDDGNRIYEIAATIMAPDRPEHSFSSLVRYNKTTERDRYASGISREALRNAPCLADAVSFLSSVLREADLILTLNPRERIETLLAGCGSPKVVDLLFAAEFFIPQAESASLKPLWEYLHGKPREKYSFTSREAVELSLDLVRHICGRVLNAPELPSAAVLRHYLDRSDTLFGRLFVHLNRNYRDYFGGLFDPSEGRDTFNWKGLLEKAPPPSSVPEKEKTHKEIPVARLKALYQGLAAKAKGYALRSSQIAYAEHVSSALNDQAVLTIEAGTGTGKTQGYLIPVFEFLRRNPQERVAISTFSKSLQEQIVRREIPLTLSLNKAYRHIPAALLKGKSNYPCAEKLDHVYEDALSGGRLIAWLYFVNRLFHFREVDGDTVGQRIHRHLNDGLFFRRLQHEISARSGCSRRHLSCPAQVVAAEARNARLIVTNHHKLALLGRDDAFAGLFDNYIIDEANHFEPAVRSAFGIEISSREMSDTLAYLESVLRRMAVGAADCPEAEIPEAMMAVAGFRELLAGFAFALAAVRGETAAGEATILPPEHPAFHEGRLKTHLEALRKGLREIAAHLAFVREPALCREMGIRTRTVDRMKTVLRDLKDYAESMNIIGEQSLSPAHVTSGTFYVRHWTISVHAVEVADIFRKEIYEGRQSVIFTSATLRQKESFDGFRRAAGMTPESESEEMGPRCDVVSPTLGENGDTMQHHVPISPTFRFEAIPSPFDPAVSEITVPPDALSGAFECKEAWLCRVAELLPGLIRRNRGRTLVLFSSYGDLEAISNRVGDEIRADGFPLLLQQNGVPTAALCEEFRSIRESVLFGVDTFWYGVDFPGETLTQVIITRIPFPHPQDPLQTARRNILPREEYWRRYRYETAIKMRQGMGRLIRSESDRGKVVVLDARFRNTEVMP
jgi:ATP-dependent DNA helicase DinG